MTLFDIIADTGAGSQYQVIQEAFSKIFHNLHIVSMLV